MIHHSSYFHLFYLCVLIVFMILLEVHLLVLSIHPFTYTHPFINPSISFCSSIHPFIHPIYLTITSLDSSKNVPFLQLSNLTFNFQQLFFNPEEFLKVRTPGSTPVLFSYALLPHSISLIQSTRRRHWQQRTVSCSWKRMMRKCRWQHPRGSGSPCARSAPLAARCWWSQWFYSGGSSGLSLAPSPPAGTKN